MSHWSEPGLLASRHDILRLPGLGVGLGVVEARRVDHASHRTRPDHLSVAGDVVVVAIVVAVAVAVVVAPIVIALVAIFVGARRASFAIKAGGSRSCRWASCHLWRRSWCEIQACCRFVEFGGCLGIQ